MKAIDTIARSVGWSLVIGAMAAGALLILQLLKGGGFTDLQGILLTGGFVATALSLVTTAAAALGIAPISKINAMADKLVQVIFALAILAAALLLAVTLLRLIWKVIQFAWS
jgi:hypothetical protein